MPLIFDKNTVKSYMYDANRGYNNRKTWASLYGNVDFSRQNQIQQNTIDYAEAINEAYKANTSANTGIYNSSLGEGYKQALIEQNRASLDNAYNTYLANLQEQNSRVNELADSYLANIQEQADSTAQYYVDLADINFDYLQYMWDTNPDALLNDVRYSKYIDKNLVTETDPVTGEVSTVLNEDGTDMYDYSLKNKETIMNELFSVPTDSEGNMILGENRGLNIRGVDFFDQMQNDTTFAQTNGFMSFNDFVKNENEELYNFMRSANPYEYNYYYDDEGNLHGDATNLGSFRTMTGRVSDDQTYAFAERFGGFTETELTHLFQPFKAIADSNFGSSEKISSKIKNQFVTESMDSINELITKLGLKDVLIEQNVDYDDFESKIQSMFNDIDNLDKDISDAKNLWAEYGWKSAAAGAVGGTIFPGVGTLIGGAIGLFLGSITGAIKGKIDSDNLENQKVEIQKEINNAYTQMVNQLVNISLSERRKKEIEFNQKYGL